MQVLLATLLVQRNRVVSAERIIEEIWGESPPRRATAALHVYISQLRKLLAVADGGTHPVVTRAPGYLMQLHGEETDVEFFSGLLSRGRACMAVGNHQEASERFEAALGLWRGPVLSGLREGPIVNGFAAWAEELRLECVELLVEVNFMLGRHRELVSFLQSVVSEHPLHETFYRQLMLALYRCNRRAEALEIYQRARNTLKAELGLEPCRALHDMHSAILTSDDRLEAGQPVAF
ncbi:AfsR/SARP family transcriptional regulator [Streptomyces noursei]|uniref:AfsR/SARP family transcriptional regulator n=1 Tax=Streptomyces noursei TaxID=1971 RepID=UPI001F04E88E|nr:AfsR/SARP family transcriptional regulator [Streptomyces noursei]